MFAMGLCAVLVVAVVNLAGAQQTIVVPPTIDKSFWVNKDTVSNEYLEQMALFLAQLELNVSPKSVDYQNQVLLTYVHPSEYGVLRTEMEVQAQRLKKESVSSWFVPAQVQTDGKGKRVAIAGELTTFVGDKVASRQPTVYVVEFRYSSGKLYLKSFQKGESNDPLGLRSAG
ncbi:MAG: hypothetical protein AMS22_11470 [Thiotrichales bacterium SG8_50]|nr:MAG: hypothetical protein AMS22_11470 [Thiotrichales bacterium SG8_50]